MKNNFSPSRRTFLRSGLVLAAGLPAIRMYPFSDAGRDGARPVSTGGDDPLFNLFRQPPTSAKPFVRWWWNGDKVTARELLHELDVLNEAGIGGVEINPIAFPPGDDLAIPSMQWLSPEWIEMVKVTLKGAAERGMICDIIVGSGWPFGAEYLQGDERSQILTRTTRKIQGPGIVEIEIAELLKEAAPRIGYPNKSSTSELYSLCLAPLAMDKFMPPTWLPFDKEQSKVSIQVPEGEHILYALVTCTGFQSVIQGSPGAAGPVLNHLNQVASQKFLDNMADKLFPQIAGLKGFRSMFCDSMELEGANWCNDFLPEFKRRRGYDIKPYLPFILFRIGEFGHAVPGGITQMTGQANEDVFRVHYDFTVTCMEIIRDRFLIPFTQWCNKHGYLSRCQAYGNEFHPLEASMCIDIPECETWMWCNDGVENRTAPKNVQEPWSHIGYLEEGRNFGMNPAYTNINKFVSSAAHLAGKKVVSCEEGTNLSAVFNMTMERMKVTCDQSNLSGVTHSVLCGFNYSPVEAPFPGWVRYGMYLNDQNTWWPYFKLFAAYKTRLSVILQETEAFADIALLHPLADMWTLYGPQRDPFPKLRHPKYQYHVWEGIHKNGNSCDYISESILQQGAMANGFLNYKNRKYNTIMLLEVETMAPATAEALLQFVKKGGKVIFVGKEPYKSPGLKNCKSNDRKVSQTVASIKRANPSQVFTVDAPADDIIAWFGNIQKQCDIQPYMKINHPVSYISQIRHQSEGKDIFFVSNCSTDDRYSIQATFPESKGKPYLWDLETGERYHYPGASGNTLTIDLPPANTQLIVFDTHGEGQDYPSLPAEKQGKELSQWRLKMEHVNGTTQERDIQSLFDLSADEQTRSFAGYLTYEKKLEGDISSFNWLDLGKVFSVSEVTLNGEILGCRWYGRHLYRIPEHLAKANEKILRIRIITTLGNYFKSNPENKVGYGWTRNQSWQPVGMLGPVKLL